MTRGPFVQIEMRCPAPPFAYTQSNTDLGAQRNLEDVAVAAATEQEAFARVKGHRHDFYIKEHREQEFA